MARVMIQMMVQMLAMSQKKKIAPVKVRMRKKVPVVVKSIRNHMMMRRNRKEMQVVSLLPQVSLDFSKDSVLKRKLRTILLKMNPTVFQQRMQKRMSQMMAVMVRVMMKTKRWKEIMKKNSKRFHFLIRLDLPKGVKPLHAIRLL